MAVRAAVFAVLAWIVLAAAAAQDAPAGTAGTISGGATTAPDSAFAVPDTSLTVIGGSAAALDTSSIALNFAWPLGAVAHVESDWFKERSNGGKSDTTALGITYVMTVKPHPEGLLVEDSDLTFLYSRATGTPADAFWLDFMQRASAMIPNMVIAPDGRLLRVEGTDAIRAQMDTLLAPIFAGLDEAPPQLKTLIESLSSDAALAARASQSWNAIVRFWLGGELTPGARYELQSEEPVAFLPGRNITMVSRFGLRQRMPCPEGTADGDCVELVLRSIPKPGAVDSLVNDLLHAAEPGMPKDLQLEGIEIENDVSVVMEPATMLPYTFYVRRFVAAQATNPDGSAHQMSQTEERRSLFTY